MVTEIPHGQGSAQEPEMEAVQDSRLEKEQTEKPRRYDEEQTSGTTTPLSELATSRPIRRFSLRRPWTDLAIASSRATTISPPRGTTTPAAMPLSSFATKLYTVSHLIFFSILGTLARIGLQALTHYPGEIGRASCRERE